MTRSLPCLVAALLIAWPPAVFAAVPALRPLQYVPAARFPVDPDLRGRLDEAAQLIRKESWPEVVHALRAIFDVPQDRLFPAKLDEADPLFGTWLSGRAEATRLLSTLPPAVLAQFVKQSEPAAQELLRTVRDKGEIPPLLEVCTRYPHTDAAAEAAALLAGIAVENGSYTAAALGFRKLLEDPKRADQMSTLALYQATVAFCFTEDPENAARAWKRLSAKVGEKPVRVEGRLLRLDELKKDVAKVKVPTRGEDGWPIHRGNVSRTALAKGRAPLLEPSWSISTLPSDGPNRVGGRGKDREWIGDYLNRATKSLTEHGLPILPAFHPVAVDGKVLFRTYDGLWITHLQEPDPDQRHWWLYTDGGAQTILGDPAKKGIMERWKDMYLQQGPHGILFENSVTGSVSTDGLRALIVDDLLNPAHRTYQTAVFGGGIGQGRLTDQVRRNSLKAYSLETAKLLWELGGKSQSGNPQLDALFGLLNNEGGSFFLGPPLPLTGLLYVLHEKDNELRLVCLGPTDRAEQRLPPPPSLLWSLPLVATRDPIAAHPLRRIHAAHLAYADGIMVCPTNAGTLLGVDITAPRIVWAYRYREAPEPVPEDKKPVTLGGWKASAPAIHDGKVVFTSPDSRDLHCLDLHTGKLLWQMPRAEEDCYFAGVYSGKVVIVSRNTVRAVRLNDGTEVWKCRDTGMPGGQGVAAANVYYLPVRSAAKDGRAEVCAIDLERGTIIAHIRMDPKAGKDAVPGNLIFYQDQLLSQTATGLTSFPLVKTPAK